MDGSMKVILCAFIGATSLVGMAHLTAALAPAAPTVQQPLSVALPPGSSTMPDLSSAPRPQPAILIDPNAINPPMTIAIPDAQQQLSPTDQSAISTPLATPTTPPAPSIPAPTPIAQPQPIAPPSQPDTMRIALPDSQQLYHDVKKDAENAMVRIAALEKQIEALMRTAPSTQSIPDQGVLREKFAQAVKQQQEQQRGAFLAQHIPK